jgi:hypothetical protein
MKSIVISPRTKKEFETTFSLVQEFSKGRNLFSLKDDDTISFAFLINAGSDAEAVQSTPPGKKSSR